MQKMRVLSFFEFSPGRMASIFKKEKEKSGSRIITE